MGKALLLGTSPSAFPIYQALLNKGVEVFLVGNSRVDSLSNMTNWIQEDYSDYESVEKIVKKLKCDFIVPSCNDAAFITACKVASSFGLPGFQLETDVDMIWDKWGYRQILKGSEYEVLSCMDRSDDLLVNEHPAPFLYKPRFSHSGIGISKIAPSEDFRSSNKNFFFEEFIEGSLHSHSVFLSNSRIVADFIVDEFSPHYEFAVSNSNYPSRLDEPQKSKVRSMSSHIAGVLGVNSGLLHTQFISNNEGVYPLETMRRCPGDFFGSMVSLSTGYDYYANYVAGYLASNIESSSESAKPKPIGRVSIYANSVGLVDSEVIPVENGIKFFHFPLRKISEQIYSHVSHKSSIILIEFANYEDMWNSIPQSKENMATVKTSNLASANNPYQ